VGKIIMRSLGDRQKDDDGTRGKAANIVFDDAPIDQAVEGISTYLLHQATSAARARVCSCTNRWRQGPRKLKIDQVLRSPIRSTRIPTSAAINSREHSSASANS